jgi:hypothetical protein
MAERPISQGPGQLSRQVTQIPEPGEGFTRFRVKVAGLRLGLLRDIIRTPLERFFNHQGWSANNLKYARKRPIRLEIGINWKYRKLAEMAVKLRTNNLTNLLVLLIFATKLLNVKNKF